MLYRLICGNYLLCFQKWERKEPSLSSIDLLPSSLSHFDAGSDSWRNFQRKEWFHYESNRPNGLHPHCWNGRHKEAHEEEHIPISPAWKAHRRCGSTPEFDSTHWFFHRTDGIHHEVSSLSQSDKQEVRYRVFHGRKRCKIGGRFCRTATQNHEPAIGWTTVAKTIKNIKIIILHTRNC